MAVTRTRDELHLCYPVLGRDQYSHDVLQRPSRFVHELPTDLYEIWRVSEEGGAEAEPGELTRDPSLFDDGPFIEE